MYFCIQVGDPYLSNEKNEEDRSLSDAIESAFILNTENCIMMWNHICIPLSYKYDISYMIDDILKLLLLLQEKDFGKTKIEWLPDTFRCDWDISWTSQNVKIICNWQHIVGNLEKILITVPVLTLKKEDFISEWKRLLYKIIQALSNSKYDVLQISDMNKLLDVYEHIHNNGKLYVERSMDKK